MCYMFWTSNVLCDLLPELLSKWCLISLESYSVLTYFGFSDYQLSTRAVQPILEVLVLPALFRTRLCLRQVQALQSAHVLIQFIKQLALQDTILYLISPLISVKVTNF